MADLNDIYKEVSLIHNNFLEKVSDSDSGLIESEVFDQLEKNIKESCNNQNDYFNELKYLEAKFYEEDYEF
jgi:hypothetical protein